MQHFNRFAMFLHHVKFNMCALLMSPFDINGLNNSKCLMNNTRILRNMKTLILPRTSEFMLETVTYSYGVLAFSSFNRFCSNHADPRNSFNRNENFTQCRNGDCTRNDRHMRQWTRDPRSRHDHCIAQQRLVATDVRTRQS